MSSDFSLTSELNLILNQGSFNRVRSQISSLNNALSMRSPVFDTNRIQETVKHIELAKNSMKSFGEQAALAARRFAAFSLSAVPMIGIIQGLRSATSEAIAFDREMVRLRQVSNEVAGGGVAKIKQEINALSTSLGVSSSQLAKVAVILKQANLTLEETQEALTALSRAALAPNFDSMEQTAEGAIAIMKQFNIQSKDLEKNLGAVNAVAGEFAVEAADLIQAIQRTGGAFKSAGSNLNELLALFTSVRQTTRESAESIATGLRTISTRIQRVETAEVLKKIGINLRYTAQEAKALNNVNLTGQFVGVYEAVKRLSVGLQDIKGTDPKFAQLIEELGGYRQISKTIPLIKEFGISQDALNVAIAGQNSLLMASKEAQNSFGNRLDKLKEKFLSLGRSIVESPGFDKFFRFLELSAESALKLTNALTPLLPMIGVLGTAMTIKAAVQVGSGFTQAIGKVPQMKYAKGGIVPGTGNTDSYETFLPSGSFVLNKAATQKMMPVALMPGERVFYPDEVKKIGLSKLHQMNRFAKGGLVDHDKIVKELARKFRLQASQSGNPISNDAALLMARSAIRPLIDAQVAYSNLPNAISPSRVTDARNKISDLQSKQNLLNIPNLQAAATQAIQNQQQNNPMARTFGILTNEEIALKNAEKQNAELQKQIDKYNQIITKNSEINRLKQVHLQRIEQQNDALNQLKASLIQYRSPIENSALSSSNNVLRNPIDLVSGSTGGFRGMIQDSIFQSEMAKIQEEFLSTTARQIRAYQKGISVEDSLNIAKSRLEGVLNGTVQTTTIRGKLLDQELVNAMQGSGYDAFGRPSAKTTIRNMGSSLLSLTGFNSTSASGLDQDTLNQRKLITGGLLLGGLTQFAPKLFGDNVNDAIQNGTTGRYQAGQMISTGGMYGIGLGVAAHSIGAGKSHTVGASALGLVLGVVEGFVNSVAKIDAQKLENINKEFDSLIRSINSGTTKFSSASINTLLENKSLQIQAGASRFMSWNTVDDIMGSILPKSFGFGNERINQIKNDREKSYEAIAPILSNVLSKQIASMNTVKGNKDLFNEDRGAILEHIKAILESEQTYRNMVDATRQNGETYSAAQARLTQSILDNAQAIKKANDDNNFKKSLQETSSYMKMFSDSLYVASTRTQHLGEEFDNIMQAAGGFVRHSPISALSRNSNILDNPGAFTSAELGNALYSSLRKFGPDLAGSVADKYAPLADVTNRLPQVLSGILKSDNISIALTDAFADITDPISKMFIDKIGQKIGAKDFDKTAAQAEGDVSNYANELLSQFLNPISQYAKRANDLQIQQSERLSVAYNKLTDQTLQLIDSYRQMDDNFLQKFRLFSKEGASSYGLMSDLFTNRQNSVFQQMGLGKISGDPEKMVAAMRAAYDITSGLEDEGKRRDLEDHEVQLYQKNQMVFRTLYKEMDELTRHFDNLTGELGRNIEFLKEQRGAGSSIVEKLAIGGLPEQIKFRQGTEILNGLMSGRVNPQAILANPQLASFMSEYANNAGNFRAFNGMNAREALNKTVYDKVISSMFPQLSPLAENTMKARQGDLIDQKNRVIGLKNQFTNEALLKADDVLVQSQKELSKEIQGLRKAIEIQKIKLEMGVDQNKLQDAENAQKLLGNFTPAELAAINKNEDQFRNAVNATNKQNLLSSALVNAPHHKTFNKNVLTNEASKRSAIESIAGLGLPDDLNEEIVTNAVGGKTVRQVIKELKQKTMNERLGALSGKGDIFGAAVNKSLNETNLTDVIKAVSVMSKFNFDMDNVSKFIQDSTTQQQKMEEAIKGVRGHFGGGLVTQNSGVPGGNSQDTVLKRLTPGEYVIPKAIVAAFGVDNINKLLSGGPLTPHFIPSRQVLTNPWEIIAAKFAGFNEIKNSPYGNMFEGFNSAEKTHITNLNRSNLYGQYDPRTNIAYINKNMSGGLTKESITNVMFHENLHRNANFRQKVSGGYTYGLYNEQYEAAYNAFKNNINFSSLQKRPDTPRWRQYFLENFGMGDSYFASGLRAQKFGQTSLAEWITEEAFVRQQSSRFTRDKILSQQSIEDILQMRKNISSIDLIKEDAILVDDFVKRANYIEQQRVIKQLKDRKSNLSIKNKVGATARVSGASLMGSVFMAGDENEEFYSTKVQNKLNEIGRNIGGTPGEFIASMLGENITGLTMIGEVLTNDLDSLILQKNKRMKSGDLLIKGGKNSLNTLLQITDTTLKSGTSLTDLALGAFGVKGFRESAIETKHQQQLENILREKADTKHANEMAAWRKKAAIQDAIHAAYESEKATKEYKERSLIIDKPFFDHVKRSKSRSAFNESPQHVGKGFKEGLKNVLSVATSGGSLIGEATNAKYEEAKKIKSGYWTIPFRGGLRNFHEDGERVMHIDPGAMEIIKRGKYTPPEYGKGGIAGFFGSALGNLVSKTNAKNITELKDGDNISPANKMYNNAIRDQVKLIEDDIKMFQDWYDTHDTKLFGDNTKYLVAMKKSYSMIAALNAAKKSNNINFADIQRYRVNIDGVIEEQQNLEKIKEFNKRGIAPPMDLFEGPGGVGNIPRTLQPGDFNDFTGKIIEAPKKREAEKVAVNQVAQRRNAWFEARKASLIEESNDPYFRKMVYDALVQKIYLTSAEIGQMRQQRLMIGQNKPTKEEWAKMLLGQQMHKTLLNFPRKNYNDLRQVANFYGLNPAINAGPIVPGMANGGIVGDADPSFKKFASMMGMKPRGTDTVPAMLTKGELVVPANVVQNMKDGGIVGSGQDFTANAAGFVRAISVFSNNTASFNNSVSKFNLGVESFGGFVNKFSESASMIPQQINVSGETGVAINLFAGNIVNEIATSINTIIAQEVSRQLISMVAPINIAERAMGG